MRQSEHFWNKIAAKYARTPIGDEASYQRKLAETQSLFSPQMRVLEFGCGTGSTAIAHSPYVSHIDAIDIADNMLEIGRQKVQRANIHNITFHQGTLEQFNADSASVDVVLGLNVIHLLPERRAVITEVARILKPGGHFVTSTACLGHSYLRFIKLLAPIGKRLGMMPDLYVMSEETLASDMRSAGFEIERQWQHGPQGISVFMIATKTTPSDNREQNSA